MKRARNEDDKERRRAEILAEARGALEESDYRDLRLSDLARNLGLVKGTLYRYFPTRQDLFMAVYREELEGWLFSWGSILGAVADGSPTGGAAKEELVALWSRSLMERRTLVRLVGEFHAVIEPELSDQGLLEFKAYLKSFLDRGAEKVEESIPELRGAGVELILGLYVLIQGCAPLCFPSLRIRGILDAEEELGIFKLEFSTFFPSLLRKLVLGTVGAEAPGLDPL